MNNDPQLSELLQKWKVEYRTSEAFQSQVWARISEKPESSLNTFKQRMTEWFVFKLPQPMYTAAVMLLFVFAALGFASVSAALTSKSENTAMKERYIRSINPLAKATERQDTL